MSDGPEREVTAEIARRSEELVALLAALVGFDTRAPDPDLAPRDEAALQEYIAQRLRAAGLAVELFEPEVARLPSNRYPIPERYSFAGRPQLVARAPGAGGGRSLLFNGHVDVVPAEPVALWTSPPFEGHVRDGRLYGRGACDMKGGVAAMVFAAEMLATMGVALRGELIVNTVTDEESTAAGALACAGRGLRADAAIVPEPTELALWPGTRGSLMPEIDVPGRAGHAGFPYAEDAQDAPVNAIEKAQIVLAALRELRDEWSERPELRGSPLQPGTIVPIAIDAGQWIVSYPASATLRCHVQYLPEQADADGTGERVRREIERRVAAAACTDPWLAAHPPRFTWHGDVPPSLVDREQPICQTTLDAMASLGLGRRIASRTTWFDGATYCRFGTPAIAFGPGSIAQAHAVDEYVPVQELVRAAQVLAVAAIRFCGVRD
ncbi:MAG: ArgE/DapE family deacylase [Solirubrobacteraceae bacterium]